jgi:hypothetical protein
MLQLFGLKCGREQRIDINGTEDRDQARKMEINDANL